MPVGIATRSNDLGPCMLWDWLAVLKMFYSVRFYFYHHTMEPVITTSAAEGDALLTNCPVCSRQVSTAADTCPQCGHPLRVAAPVQAGAKCYSCSAAATTRCQSCEALSCALHLQSIYVTHGRGGAYELRCESCHSEAEIWKVVGGIATVIVIVVILIYASGGW